MSEIKPTEPEEAVAATIIPTKENLVEKLTDGVSLKVKEALSDLFSKDTFKTVDFANEGLSDTLKQVNEDKVLEAIKAYTEKREKDVDAEKVDFSEFLSSTTAEESNDPNNSNGPNKTKIDALLEETKYKIEVTSGQRRYGGPPPKEIYDGPDPGPQCQVFIGKIPKNAFEDEIVPLLQQCGTIWDFRLMMEPMTGRNRGFGFCSFTTKEAAMKCVKEVDNKEIRPSKQLGVCLSQSNCRLFVGSIPKTKTKDQIFEEFSGITNGLKDVIVYLQTEDKNKNRGFCFLEYVDHKAASLARRKLSSPKVKAFKNPISVDWADPIEEPSEEIMAKVKVLYVKNLSIKATEEMIKTTFSKYGQVDRVKKIKDYAFVHFKEREEAMKALEELNGETIEGEAIEITLAKPIDRKKRERQMERKMLTSFNGMGMHGMGGRYPMQMGRGNNRMMNYPPPVPQMGGYPGFADDFMMNDYYGGGGGNGQFFYNDQPQFYNPAGGFHRGRGGKRGGMFGGRGGGGGGMRGNNRGGRGGMKNWQRGGARGGMNGKRKGDNMSNEQKRKRNDGSDDCWGNQPIVQQPLNTSNGGDYWC